jgi:hypothetical protein
MLRARFPVIDSWEKTVYTPVYKFLSSEGAGKECVKGTFLPKLSRVGSHTGKYRVRQEIENVPKVRFKIESNREKLRKVS